MLCYYVLAYFIIFNHLEAIKQLFYTIFASFLVHFNCSLLLLSHFNICFVIISGPHGITDNYFNLCIYFITI